MFDIDRLKRLAGLREAAEGPDAGPPLTGAAFTALRRHHGIAWDFDETLVDHPASIRLQAFIVANPQIHHVIVTFRSHGMERRVWDDLARYPDAPTEAAFAGMINISNRAYEAFSRDNDARVDGLKPLTGPLTPAELYYVNWKGRMAAQHGLTALVDDRTEQVAAGCQTYGITLFHPADFL